MNGDQVEHGKGSILYVIFKFEAVVDVSGAPIKGSQLEDEYEGCIEV